MREVLTNTDGSFDKQTLAEKARVYAEDVGQSYDDISVGAIASFKLTKAGKSRRVAYAGTNINLSGMQTKVHAEQLALQQAIIDFHDSHQKTDKKLEKMVVATSSDKKYLTCGNCLQVTRSVCEYIDCSPRTVDYIAATYNPRIGDYDYREEKLDDLLGTTYAEW